MHRACGMPTQAIELEDRAAKLADAIKGLTTTADPSKRGRQLLADAVKHSEQVAPGYRHACASSSPDQFASRISEVAVHARRTKALLMLLVQLGYVPVADIRELIMEARGLENILVASRNTARRRLHNRRNSQRRAQPRHCAEESLRSRPTKST